MKNLELKRRIAIQRRSVSAHVKAARSFIRDRNYTEAIRSLVWATQVDAFGDGLDRAEEILRDLKGSKR